MVDIQNQQNIINENIVNLEDNININNDYIQQMADILIRNQNNNILNNQNNQNDNENNQNNNDNDNNNIIFYNNINYNDE